MPDPGPALAHLASGPKASTARRVAPSEGWSSQAARSRQDLPAVRVHHHHHHHDDAAAEAAERLEASAFTVGRDVYFARGSYRPHTPAGRRLLAHEFAHVIQQREAGAPRVQRRIREDVTAWTATTLGPPVPVNGADPRMITIPPTGQILITADVDVHGDPADPCSTMEVGTTQTAWMASTVMIYRGRTSAEGSVVVRHNAAMPQGDPGPAGSVWYDPVNVRRPAACGGSVQIRHVDSPWHSPPKARNNAAVAGNPLNYLTWYRRGLNAVTLPHYPGRRRRIPASAAAVPVLGDDPGVQFHPPIPGTTGERGVPGHVAVHGRHQSHHRHQRPWRHGRRALLHHRHWHRLQHPLQHLRQLDHDRAADLVSQ